MTSFRFEAGGYRVTSSLEQPPPAYETIVDRASLHDDFRGVASGPLLVVQVGRLTDEWPALVISQRFSPGIEAGFVPGALLVPEHEVLFLGAGTRLLAYDLGGPNRLWLDEADTGFWHWRRHGDLVIMSAELELAAWDVRGRKLWSTFVEPPWEYELRDGYVFLDVMGHRSAFPAASGPTDLE